MSSKSLLEFCNKLNDTLNSPKGSQLYRNLVANKRVHSFKFDARTMASQMKKALQNSPSFDGLTQQDKKVIDDAALEMRKELGKKLDKLVAEMRTKGAVLKSSHTANIVRITFDVNTASNTIITLFTGKTIELSPDDVFSKVKQFYRPALKKFFDTVQAHLKSTVKINPESGRMINRSLRTASGKSRKGPGRVFHAGHEKGAGIFESFMRDVFEGIAGATSLDPEVTQKDLQTIGMTTLVKAVRNDKNDSHDISIESAYLNIKGKDGGVSVSALRATLKTQLAAAIKKLEKAVDIGENLKDVQGSDSINTKKQKILLASVLKAFSENQKIRSLDVKTKNTLGKVKTSSGQGKKKVKSKGSKAKSAGIALGAGVKAGRVRRDRKSTEGPASSPLRLITEFNKQLPSIVRKNMGPPALSNDTGRFADSVKVENIIQTPKGFPSVGYTYQRSPYQVFEEGMGSPPWADGNRDPRDLIDKSIREIATMMALGRFYTRRI